MSNRCQTERMIVGVKGVVFHPEYNKILLLRRKRNQQITLPGGQYDPGLDETLEDTFDRELLEESNLRRKLNVPFSIIGVHYFNPYGGCKTVARVIGLTQAKSEHVKLDEDQDYFLWVHPTLQKLAALALENTTKDELAFLFEEDGTQKLEPVSPGGVILPFGMEPAA